VESAPPPPQAPRKNIVEQQTVKGRKVGTLRNFVFIVMRLSEGKSEKIWH
jgi:hypothetical protein